MKLTKNTLMSYSNFNSLMDNIIDLAKEIMPDKIIYVNFLNDDLQITMKVSKHDTDVKVEEGITIPADDAVCNQINYKEGKPLIIEDTSKTKFSDEVKKTIKDSNLGSYLGIPITFKDGGRFGALCAAHHDKSTFDQKDVALLQNIAQLFSYYLELEHLAYKDVITSLQNKQYLLLEAPNILKDGGTLIMLDLDNFKNVNDTFGHDKGDDVLREVASKIEDFVKDYNNTISVRLGGDEFIIYISDEKSYQDIHQALISLVNSLKVWETPIGDVKLSASIGAVRFHSQEEKSMDTLLKHADELLYRAKRSGKSQFILE